MRWTIGRWYLCVLAVAACATVCPAQDTLWLRRFDFGTDAQAIGIDYRDGIIAVAGALSDSLRFDSDILVMRCTAEGETLWTRRFDSGGQDGAVSVAIDAEGSIVVHGYGIVFEDRRGRPVLLPCELLRAAADQESLYSITIKYDSLGEQNWIHSEPNVLGFGLAIDEDGNCYISGAKFLVTTFDILFAKLDPSGETLWTRVLDVGTFDIGYRLALCPDGNLAMAGIVGGDENRDCMAAKFTPSGDTLWLRTFDVASDDIMIGVAVDPSSGSVVTSGFAQDIDSARIVALKYDAAGVLVWSRTFSPGRWNEAYDAGCDSAGSSFIAGSTGESMYDDYLVMKLTATGDLAWSAVYRGEGEDFCQAVTCDPQGNPITAGAAENWNFYWDLLAVKYVGASGIAQPYPAVSRPRVQASVVRGTRLAIAVPESGPYRFELLDPAGRRLAAMHQGWLSTGLHSLSLPHLTGIGFLRVLGPSVNATFKTVVLPQ